eukprot:TRINITY_DN50702_c0_g1_i1.p1 TRINITY_DN50702_c0_g1~~TRINITY_DN50702_c0_g1_i1.p1  ORF type:complete len:252 (+),score=62.99 TRINITY_DN50702_c0_g1_i1:856-1611(+)
MRAKLAQSLFVTKAAQSQVQRDPNAEAQALAAANAATVRVKQTRASQQAEVAEESQQLKGKEWTPEQIAADRHKAAARCLQNAAAEVRARETAKAEATQKQRKAEMQQRAEEREEQEQRMVVVRSQIYAFNQLLVASEKVQLESLLGCTPTETCEIDNVSGCEEDQSVAHESRGNNQEENQENATEEAGTQGGRDIGELRGGSHQNTDAVAEGSPQADHSESTSQEPQLQKSPSTIIALSLIHISEPTRPY